MEIKKHIKAKSAGQLKLLIAGEMRVHGPNCSLNHIDISALNDLSYLFQYCEFNGDISGWDMRGIKSIAGMFRNSSFNQDIGDWDTSGIVMFNEAFEGSQFNKDISRWNTSRAQDMSSMFKDSLFNQDISLWDVSQVRDMSKMFFRSQFKGDLSMWCPLALERGQLLFFKCAGAIPYWASYEQKELRDKAIIAYQRQEQLRQSLCLPSLEPQSITLEGREKDKKKSKTKI